MTINTIYYAYYYNPFQMDKFYICVNTPIDIYENVHSGFFQNS